ncbi:MAG: hypothetical protein AAF909_14920 [Pseudomonadota bacterium]
MFRNKTTRRVAAAFAISAMGGASALAEPLTAAQPAGGAGGAQVWFGGGAEPAPVVNVHHHGHYGHGYAHHGHGKYGHGKYGHGYYDPHYGYKRKKRRNRRRNVAIGVGAAIVGLGLVAALSQQGRHRGHSHAAPRTYRSGDGCDYWADQCARNWGANNNNFYGCLRYHRC